MPDKWLVLDAMGVVYVVGDDTNDLLVPYIQTRNSGISRERINELYRQTSLGEHTSRGFWELLGLGEHYPVIEQDYLDTCLTLDPSFRNVASKLKHTYRLGMLSNDVKEWSAYLRHRFGLDDLFEVAVVSGEVGLRKPNPRIYHLLLERLRCRAEDCIFVDDSLRRLEAAAAIGLRTIHLARTPSASAFRPDAQITCFTELPSALALLV